MSLNLLFDSLRGRLRPEDVAGLILGMNVLNAAESAQLQPLTRWWSRSSMPASFDNADDLSTHVEKARILFPSVTMAVDPSSVSQLEAYIAALMVDLGVTGLDFKADRPERDARVERSMNYTGHRGFNKRFRHVRQMTEKLARYRKVATLRTLARVAKSRLTFRITREQFLADEASALYIAYMTARLNRRSVFTFDKQDRAFDDVAAMLFKRLNPATAQWFAIALMDSTPEVLAHLTAEQRGTLLAEWYEIMKVACAMLRELAETGGYNLSTMIVRRGNDSSSWNEAAGAYNLVRQGWVNAMEMAGMGEALDQFLPTKALRLMAADVAWGHQHYGSGGLDPDTSVWNELPRPWDVVLGQVECTRETVRLACEKHGVEPHKWMGQRERVAVATQYTPELVHGVSVGSPDLARLLRRLGVFSGPSKGLKGILADGEEEEGYYA